MTSSSARNRSICMPNQWNSLFALRNEMTEEQPRVTFKYSSMQESECRWQSMYERCRIPGTFVNLHVCEDVMPSSTIHTSEFLWSGYNHFNNVAIDLEVYGYHAQVPKMDVHSNIDQMNILLYGHVVSLEPNLTIVQIMATSMEPEATIGEVCGLTFGRILQSIGLIANRKVLQPCNLNISFMDCE